MSLIIPVVVHGYAEVPKDSVLLPERFWSNVVPHAECWDWVANVGSMPASQARKGAASRLLGLPISVIGSVEPSCGSLLCVNPSHLCVRFAPGRAPKEAF